MAGQRLSGIAGDITMIAVFVTVLSGCSGPQGQTSSSLSSIDPVATREALESELRSLQVEHELPGMTLALVTRDGRQSPLPWEPPMLSKRFR